VSSIPRIPKIPFSWMERRGINPLSSKGLKPEDLNLETIDTMKRKTFSKRMAQQKVGKVTRLRDKFSTLRVGTLGKVHRIENGDGEWSLIVQWMSAYSQPTGLEHKFTKQEYHQYLEE
jgi:hypothetical protein